MRFSFLFLFLPISIIFADVSRFIDSIELPGAGGQIKVFTKSSALISSRPVSLRSYSDDTVVLPSTITLSREILEQRLGESIAHRYQASGKVVAFLTREWNSIKVSSNYLIKISLGKKRHIKVELN